MRLTLKIWRQKNAQAKGQLQTYTIDEVDGDMSFLEMLDVLNTQLIDQGEEPVVFDHDCREGICGSCSLQINGEPHGPDRLARCSPDVDPLRSGDGTGRLDGGF